MNTFFHFLSLFSASIIGLIVCFLVTGLVYTYAEQTKRYKKLSTRIALGLGAVSGILVGVLSEFIMQSSI